LIMPEEEEEARNGIPEYEIRRGRELAKLCGWTDDQFRKYYGVPLNPERDDG